MASDSKIVVATDLSEDARAAAEWASEYAKGAGAEVVLAHVVQLSPHHWATSAWGFLDDERLREEAESNVRKWYTDVTGEEPASVHVRAGTPPVQLRELVEDQKADLLVISRSGKRGWEKFWLGSTAKALALEPPCRLVVVHPAERRPDVRDVVVGTDFSANADRALSVGAAFARQFGARLHIVHAEEVDQVDAIDALAGGTLPSEYRRSDKEIDAARGLEQLERDHASELEGVDYETKLTREDPATGLVEYVERNKSDLLVIGRAGRSRLLANVLGSTVNRVIQIAPTTLVITPTE